MSDLRSTLEGVEQQIHARPDALERVRIQHRRRRRTRRMAGAALQALVVVVAVAAIAVAFRFVQLHDAVGAPTIDATNVDRLAPAWQRDISGGGSSRAVVADGIIYAASDDGALSAVDARTGEIQWVGPTALGAPTSPVVAAGTVLLHVGGRLYAFAIDCASGGATCASQWSARTGGGNEAAPTVSDGTVYVVATPGGITAFPLACAMPCTPLWTVTYQEGHMARSVAVSDGVVWDSSTHALSAYPAACGSAGASCQALIANVAPDGADLASPPAIADGVIYVGASDGSLYAVPAACATGDAASCEPLWRAHTGGSIAATPLLAGGRVYVASSDGLIYAFPAMCADPGGSCPPLWVGRTGGPLKEQPVVANGLAYVTSTDGYMYAFADASATLGSERAPLVVESVGPLPPTPMVAGGHTLVTIAADGRLTAWTIDGASPDGLR